MQRKCLLGCFAHPDDEVFGLGGSFRRYRDRGIYTALVCATRGEEGEISDDALATPETLGEVREAELREACSIMGVEDLVFLGYRDGSLQEADSHEAIGKIVYEIRRVRPQVVVTFDRQGGYGHVDHIAIHHLTVQAFGQAGDPSCYPEQIEGRLKPHAPQKLYAVAFARSAMRRAMATMEDANLSFSPGGSMATIPVEQMGQEDNEITTAIALDEAQFAAKQRAMAAHRTQMTPDGPMSALGPDDLRAWLGVERFVLLDPPGSPGNSVERDLFAGVRL